MSNAIRYDALLVHDLAAELNGTLAGCRMDEVCLDRASLRVSLRFRGARRSDPPPPPLLWNLHPGDGALLRLEHPVVLGGHVQLAAHTFVRSVSAPPDERILHIELDPGDDAVAGAARRIVIELVTNQWNAIALSAGDRISAVLRERHTRERELRAGIAYEPPARSLRAGRDGPLGRADWRRILAGCEPGTRLNALVREIAFTSPLNAAALLGDADVSDDDAALDRAHERYVAVIWAGPRVPVVLHIDGTAQPYSRVIGPAASRTATLLDAFDIVARDVVRDTAQLSERALDVIGQRIDAARRRVQRLKAQQDGAEVEAARLRTLADLLLAQLHRIPRGAAAAELDDFAGGVLPVELDPTLTAAENAARMYDAARRRSRAAARIPRLLRTARREIEELEALAARVREGEVDEDTLRRLRPARKTRGPDTGPALPYRTYRTTGGLEVRVGRGSRANDALTFRHSSPTDVWLHARDVAGAHVILRWPRSDENPPASDIAEAAVLAALFSRARTSGLVAVDWTRRKWVRKPRKAPPGLVIPERVRTVFVEPDARLEERLRLEPTL